MELRGDLHVHTGRSPDSRAELSAILAAANRAGLDFIALTDHDLPPEEDIFAKPERAGADGSSAGGRWIKITSPPGCRSPICAGQNTQRYFFIKLISKVIKLEWLA